jgi:hypothetical protein
MDSPGENRTITNQNNLTSVQEKRIAMADYPRKVDFYSRILRWRNLGKPRNAGKARRDCALFQELFTKRRNAFAMRKYLRFLRFALLSGCAFHHQLF